MVPILPYTQNTYSVKTKNLFKIYTMQILGLYKYHKNIFTISNCTVFFTFHGTL